ncbi:MAG TPA: GFA family protein, partial [Rhodopila sp.]
AQDRPAGFTGSWSDRSLITGAYNWASLGMTSQQEVAPMHDFSINGRCACGSVRYRIISEPLIVHCCHCRWCQRETGTAFALNALIEADRVVVSEGSPEVVWTPSNSGKGQKIARCATCRIALWSNYVGAGDLVRFVRVGTLDEPDRLPPDIHIFTMSKQPWVLLPAETPAFEAYYDREKYWPATSLARRRAMLQRRSN